MGRRAHQFLFSFLCLCFALIACSVTAVYATTQEEAEKIFSEFQTEWMQKLNTQGRHGKEGAQVLAALNKDGMYVAEYIELSKPTSSEVKSTGVKDSPYVGILHYDKTVYNAEGKTKEEALQGPYRIANEQSITEIFRFSKGKWVY